MDAVVARLTATLDAHDAVARGEGAPDGTTFPILASKADLRALLAHVARLREDEKRLDWMQSVCARYDGMMLNGHADGWDATVWLRYGTPENPWGSRAKHEFRLGVVPGLDDVAAVHAQHLGLFRAALDAARSVPAPTRERRDNAD